MRSLLDPTNQAAISPLFHVTRRKIDDLAVAVAPLEGHRLFPIVIQTEQPDQTDKLSAISLSVAKLLGCRAMPSPRHFCSATTAMNGQPEKPHHILMISRRDTLVGGVAVLAGGAIASACTSLALAAIEPSTQDRFMRMSELLINHQLSPDVGARIVDMAVGQYKDLPSMLDAIIAIAEHKHSAVVEDFFGDIPDGNLKDFGYWVILTWYSGCSSEKADATVFTYEDALTFKTTADVVAIPAYCFSGSNGWSQTTVPLQNMPKF